MLIRVTWKRFLCAILIVIFGVLIYLDQTNWWFDRKLERLANPLLKNVIKHGFYRIPEVEKCPRETMQIHYDVKSVASSLITDIKLFNISFVKCPMTQLRMIDDPQVDRKLFFSEKLPKNTCDKEERYNGYLRNSNMLRNMLERYQNFKVYSFYTDNSCINDDIFQKNLSSYKNIFAKKVIDNREISHGGFWIISHKKYYYLIAENNGMQPDNQDKDKERYLIFKKLTMQELMTYDNGSYWRLITKYNIKID